MSKLTKINKAAREIARAENVPHDVAMTWAWQCWEEWNKREAKWAALEERAALLRRFPAAAKKAKVGGIRIYGGVPKTSTERALERRAKHEEQAPAPLMSSEEYWAQKRAEREAHTPRAGEGPRVAA